MPKLVAIGDSLTQGVQSGAVFRPECSYPVRIAQAMDLDVPGDFHAPGFPGSGLPLNIEWLLRSMYSDLKDTIELLEWFTDVPFSLARHLDYIEDYYERGPGSRPDRYSGVYHNLAVAGFRVYDSFTVDSNYCRSQIDNTEGWIKDDFLGLPSASMYRIARRVLNPHLIPNRGTWTQIDNLRYFAENDDPVENLILFLGANDCLGTIRDLKIKTPNRKYTDPEKRRDKYNLTSLSVFQEDYSHMVNLISEAISPKTRVFVGTIPHVTIAPITQGLGATVPEKNDKNKQYYENYGPFFATDKNFRTEFGRTLSRRDVRRIDNRIDAFNRIITDEVRKVNEENNEENWHIVDICKLLDSLAIKRNANLIESSDELKAQAVLKKFFEKKDASGHPLLDLKPTPSVFRLDSCSTNRGKKGNHTHRTAGGFFSLDCFHPTTLGYGLIAEAFLDKMKEVQVHEIHENGRPPWEQLDWRTLIQQDTLVNNPPALWDDIVDAATAHPHLADIIYRILM